MDRRDNPLGALRVADRRMVGLVDRRMVGPVGPRLVGQVEEHHPQVAQVVDLVVEDRVGQEVAHLDRCVGYMGE